MTEQPVALVTAAGRGIGAGCARALSGAGFRVVLMSPSSSSERLAKELDGLAMPGSVLVEEDLRSLVELAERSFGRVDAVVNNMGHGGTLPGPIGGAQEVRETGAGLLDIPEETWRESFSMYVLSVVRIARIVTPIMLRQRKGAIVNISSFNALEPTPMYPMSTLRGALHAFTKVYADQYGPSGIRMNNLLPGYVQTESVSLTPQALAGIPMRRMGSVEEIGAVCRFLCEDASSYITGQNILVDGGLNRAVR